MPLFEHRHHKALAAAISDASDCGDTAPIMRALSHMLRIDNPRFDTSRFMLACTGQPMPKDILPLKVWVTEAAEFPVPTSRIWWVSSFGDGRIETMICRTEEEFCSARRRVERQLIEGRIAYYTFGLRD